MQFLKKNNVSFINIAVITVYLKIDFIRLEIGQLIENSTYFSQNDTTFQ